MEIKPDEIASILRERIEGMDTASADLTEVGTVLSVADGIARIHGLDNCMALEMLELPHEVTGLALNLEADNVGAVLFGEWDKIVEGDTVKRTGNLLQIPVGDELLGGGKVLNPASLAQMSRIHGDSFGAAPERYYGLGLGVAVWEGRTLLNHSGGLHPFGSAFVVDPAEKAVCAAMFDDPAGYAVAGPAVLDDLLGRRTRPLPPRPLEVDWRDYLGSYLMDLPV